MHHSHSNPNSQLENKVQSSRVRAGNLQNPFRTVYAVMWCTIQVSLAGDCGPSFNAVETEGFRRLSRSWVSATFTPHYSSLWKVRPVFKLRRSVSGGEHGMHARSQQVNRMASLVRVSMHTEWM